MANFPVGQRVRVVNRNGYLNDDLIGAVGVVTGHNRWVLVDVGIAGALHGGGTVWEFHPVNLVPIDDHDFERFMERVMKPIDEPVTA